MNRRVQHLQDAALFEQFMSNLDKPEPTISSLIPLFDEPLCAQIDGDLFFAESNGSYPAEAYAVCQRCIHRVECAEYALGYTNLLGLWGGLSEIARRRIRKARGIIGKPVETTLW